MRLGLFPVMIGRQAGGPETYEQKLIEALTTVDGENEYHIFCHDKAAANAFGFEHRNVQFHILRPRWRSISTAASLPLGLLMKRIELMHATFIPPPISPVPYVFTMHDISMFIYPEFYPSTIRLRLNKLIERGVRKARLILCISEQCKQMTMEYFKVSPERCAVAHHGVGTQYRLIDREQAAARLLEKYGIRQPFILFVGKYEERKNIARLIEAFASLRTEVDGEVRLVLVGKRDWTGRQIDEIIDKFGVRDRIIEPGYVDGDDLPLLYNAAEVFAFPTLWEGFGLPVLEAMACGVPVVASRVSCIPEVAGNAALFFDPRSVGEIADALHRFLTNSALREEYKQRGLKRASEFTWANSARQTLAAYAQAVQL